MAQMKSDEYRRMVTTNQRNVRQRNVGARSAQSRMTSPTRPTTSTTPSATRRSPSMPAAPARNSPSVRNVKGLETQVQAMNRTESHPAIPKQRDGTRTATLSTPALPSVSTHQEASQYTKMQPGRAFVAPKTSPRPQARPVNVYTNAPSLSEAMKRPQFTTLLRMTKRDMYDK